MNKNQLVNLIELTLKEIGLYSEEAVILLLGTAAQESHLGKYIRQINGPASGIFQMEPNTFNDIDENFLKQKPLLRNSIIKSCNIAELKAESLEYNLKLAICFCRLHYRRVKKELPKVYDIEGMANYWKDYYNTYLGKGTVKEFIDNFNRFVK